MVGHQLQTDEWIEMTVLVTVKAYPSVSMKHGEAVCVAGIRTDTRFPQWVRFFPVKVPDLPESQQFKKYDLSKLHAKRHSTDRRAGSLRPDLGSNEVLQNVSAVRWRVGLASQDTHLLHDSLRANLLYAKPDADEDEIYEALEHVGLLPTILELPAQLDTESANEARASLAASANASRLRGSYCGALPSCC